MGGEGDKNRKMIFVKYVWMGILIAFVLDFLGVFVWALSGQSPVDNFFWGSTSSWIIRSFLNLF